MIYFVEYYPKGGAAYGMPKTEQFFNIDDARDFAKKKKAEGYKVTISQAQNNQKAWQAKTIEFL